MCVEFTGAFHIHYCTFTLYLLHGLDVVSNHSIYLFWLVWGAHGVGIIFWLVLIDSFKIDESVAEGCVRWSTARLNLNDYLVQAFGLHHAALVVFITVVVGTPRSRSLLSLDRYVCKVRYRRRCSEMRPMWDYIIDYYPAVVPSCKDPINISVSDAANILESGARLCVGVYSPENILDRTEKQLTVDRVCRNRRRKDLPFGIALVNDSNLRRCTWVACSRDLSLLEVVTSLKCSVVQADREPRNQTSKAGLGPLERGCGDRPHWSIKSQLVHNSN